MRHTHRGVSKNARCGVEDLPVPVSVVAAARAKLAWLKAEQAVELGKSSAAAVAESSDDDSSSSDDESGPEWPGDEGE